MAAIVTPRTRRRTARRDLVPRLLMIFALAGCGDVSAPAWPTGVVPLVPRPVQFQSWWRMVEACSGVHGDLDAVSWYRERTGVITVDGEQYDGYWFGAGNRIVLASDAEFDGRIVRHEMLHALLQNGGHPEEYFVTRCGALAPCGSACHSSESNRGVPADARQIPSESLSVVISLAPSGAPALSVDSGWVTVMVTATNSRPEPVWVSIPGDINFGYVRARDAGQGNWATEPRMAFRAGESRSLAFDFQFLPNLGQDTLWGFFGKAFSPPQPISLGR